MPEGNTNAVSTPRSKNKMWYVIGGIIVIVLIGWFLTRSGGLLGAGAGVDVDQNIDGSKTYTNDEGTVTVGGGSLPENWPSDAPGVYSGASIQYSGSSNPQTGKAGAAVVYTAKASVKSVIDYYRTELSKAGWNVEATATMGGATVFSAKKDTRTIGVYVVDSGDGSVNVTAGIEM